MDVPERKTIVVGDVVVHSNQLFTPCFRQGDRLQDGRESGMRRICVRNFGKQRLTDRIDWDNVPRERIARARIFRTIIAWADI